jgi:hypothetical protein
MGFFNSQRKTIEVILAALVLVLVLVLVLAGCDFLEPRIPVSALQIGDFIQFGRYDGEPILWRVIEDSANLLAEIGDSVTGNPLLLSDHVITSKPFDAAGSHGDDPYRSEDGSNLWRDSNLRAWLNSEADSGLIVWPDGIAPIEANVTENAYGDEAGFLSAGNFSGDGISMIEPLTHKSLLYGTDYGIAEGGTYGYDYDDKVDLMIRNYDEAYFIMVTDKVFLLDPKQLNNLWNRFGDYYSSTSSYWIGAPDTSKYVDSSSANVLYVRDDGLIMYAEAKRGDIGVRPALVLDRDSVDSLRGGGTLLEPYVIITNR